MEINNLLQIDSFPFSANDIKFEIRRDHITSKFLDLTLNGWTEKPQDKRLKPYFTRRNELSVQHGCLMWGIRVIIPLKLRNKVPEEPHVGHIDIVKMKELRRSFLWWPGLDNEIEKSAKRCVGCQINSKSPRKYRYTLGNGCLHLENASILTSLDHFWVGWLVGWMVVLGLTAL